MKLLTIPVLAAIMVSCTPATASTEMAVKYCTVVKKIAVTAMTAAQYQEDYMRMTEGFTSNNIVMSLYNEAYKISETELYETEEHINKRIKQFANAKARQCLVERGVQ